MQRDENASKDEPWVRGGARDSGRGQGGSGAMGKFAASNADNFAVYRAQECTRAGAACPRLHSG